MPSPGGRVCRRVSYRVARSQDEKAIDRYRTPAARRTRPRRSGRARVCGRPPDHGAYLNGWRNASAARTGGTTNAISPSDRMSWTTIWVCPVSRSHSSVTVRPSPRRISSSTNIERPHAVRTVGPEFLVSGACEHFPTLALERAEIVEVCRPGRVVSPAEESQARCLARDVSSASRGLGAQDSSLLQVPQAVVRARLRAIRIPPRPLLGPGEPHPHDRRGAGPGGAGPRDEGPRGE